jgi:nucleotide-binding universal stress UspA family protein
MKTILVCLDSSTRAPFVLATAAKIAGQTGAHLRLLRAVGLPPEVDQELLVHSEADVLQMLTRKAKADLEALAKRLSEVGPQAVIDGIDIHVGSPWDTICREAAAIDCDLVVLGSHGYSGLDRVLGTTAAKVVNHCDRSVLVARPRPGRDS